jgi:hypothetical protein
MGKIFDKTEAEGEGKDKKKKSYKREKVCESRVEYDANYMYFLDKGGDVYRSPRSVGTKRISKKEKVLDLKIVKKPNHLYWVNALGEIWCVAMNRGGIGRAKHRRRYAFKSEIERKEEHNKFVKKVEDEVLFN